MKKSKIIIFILITSLFALLSYATVDSQIKKSQQQLDKTRQEIKKIDGQQAEIKAKQTELEKQIKGLNKDIRTIEAKMQKLSEEIEFTEAAIGIKEAELAEAEKEVAYQNERMKKRLRTMHKAGNFTYLEIILGAEDFLDMMTRLDKVQLLLDYDKKTLTHLVDMRNFIEETKVQLEDKQAELKTFKDALSVEKINLKGKYSQLVTKQAELRKNYEALANAEKELVNTANALTKTIKSLELKKIYVGGELQWPLPMKYTRINSDFGMRLHPILKVKMLHTGIDLPAPKGTPIYASGDGQVIYSDWLGSYGKAVIIDHGGGIVTLYGHCSVLVAKVGQNVKRGQVIAKIGTTGRSTGNHLHFEVRKNGKYVDPKKYLKKR